MALYAQAGSAKTKRPTAQLVLLGILAGALIALGCAATNTAAYGIADTWTARMVCGLLFPFGLGMVIMSGAELFTGNCLIAISLLERQCTPAGMLRNWAIVYLSNFAGALLVAAGCAFFGQLNYSGGLLAVFTMKLAAGKCALPFQNAFVLAILCNLLVCLGVILAMTAKDTAGRFIGAFLPVCYFVICGFEHCVANMYYIPAGLMDYELVRQGDFRGALDALARGGLLSPAERQAIRLDWLRGFFASELGQRALRALEVHREWAFNLRGPGETLIQGVIDLCFLENGQWVLVDYKTDRADGDTLRQRYSLQLSWYAKALAQITGQPVAQMHLFALRTQEDILL